MNCKKCNNIIPSGLNICPNCGEKVNTSSIIMPTETEPLPMPNEGINNTSIPEIEPIKKMDNNVGYESKTSNSSIKSTVIVAIIGLLSLAVVIFVIFRFVIPIFKGDTPEVEPQQVVTETIMGTDEYGYVALPGEWKLFDNEYRTALQYSQDDWIVSLESFEKTNETETAESLVTELNERMNNEPDHYENVKLETVKVSNYDAYKVSWHDAEEEIWYAAWVFETGDNNTIYSIEIQGPDETSAYFEIPDTFSLTEIE